MRSPQLAPSMDTALDHPTINPWLEDRRLGNLPLEIGPSISSTSTRVQTTNQSIPPLLGPEAPPSEGNPESALVARGPPSRDELPEGALDTEGKGGNIEEEGLTTLTQMYEELKEKWHRVRTIESKARIDTIR